MVEELVWTAQFQRQVFMAHQPAQISLAVRRHEGHRLADVVQERSDGADLDDVPIRITPVEHSARCFDRVFEQPARPAVMRTKACRRGEKGSADLPVVQNCCDEPTQGNRIEASDDLT